MPNVEKAIHRLKNFWNDLIFEPETAATLQYANGAQIPESPAFPQSPEPEWQESFAATAEEPAPEITEYETAADSANAEFLQPEQQTETAEMGAQEMETPETINAYEEAAQPLANSEEETANAPKISIPGLTDFARNIAVTEARRFKEAASKAQEQKNHYDY